MNHRDTAVRYLLKGAATRLPASETPWLDALVILEWSSGLQREQLLGELASSTTELLDPAAYARFQDAVDRRASGTPIAYITGTREFWSLPFAVGPGVLIPRPETELLVEEALLAAEHVAVGQERPFAVHDCCTGSGAVGIALALELADRGRTVDLHLSDISTDALRYAAINAERHLADRSRVRVTVVEADLLSTTTPPVDIVTANPPYLTEDAADEALSHGWGEPRLALAAGVDGLALYPRLAQEAFGRLRAGGTLILECAPEQAQSILSLLTASIGYTDGRINHDGAGRPRVVVATKPLETVHEEK